MSVRTLGVTVGQRVVYATFTLPIMQFALPTCENVKCVCVCFDQKVSRNVDACDSGSVPRGGKNS